jgi:hypothetical protein
VQSKWSIVPIYTSLETCEIGSVSPPAPRLEPAFLTTASNEKIVGSSSSNRQKGRVILPLLLLHSSHCPRIYTQLLSFSFLTPTLAPLIPKTPLQPSWPTRRHRNHAHVSSVNSCPNITTYNICSHSSQARGSLHKIQALQAAQHPRSPMAQQDHPEASALAVDRLA